MCCTAILFSVNTSLTNTSAYLSCLISPTRSGYNCVIYGWDPKCTMSQEWITTMRVHQLSNGANQPFYNVLVQDGTCRYAAQGTDHIHHVMMREISFHGEHIFTGCVMKKKSRQICVSLINDLGNKRIIAPARQQLQINQVEHPEK